MTSRTVLASIVTSMLLVSFALSNGAAQSFSVEKKVQDRAWLIKYILAGRSSFAIGDIFTFDGTVNKYPGSCFAGLQTTRWEDYEVPAKDYVVWKRSRFDIIKGIDIDVGVIKEEGKPDKVEQHGKLTLKPSEGADRITASISFRGTREEVHPQILNNYAVKSDWSGECGTLVRSGNSYVTADIVRGFVRISFAETIEGKRNPMDFAMPPWWKKETDDKGNVFFERETTLLIARHPKLETKRSKVIGMKLEGYLPHL